MDTVLRMVYRAIGPILTMGGIALALVLQNNVSRSITAVQDLLEDTYALSATESAGVEEILYSPDDMKSILYGTDDIAVSIEIHDYFNLRHYRFTRTASSFEIETAMSGGIGDVIPYTIVFAANDFDAIPDNQIASYFNTIVGNYYAEYDYSEINGSTNIIFTRRS